MSKITEILFKAGAQQGHEFFGNQHVKVAAQAAANEAERIVSEASSSGDHSKAIDATKKLQALMASPSFDKLSSTDKAMANAAADVLKGTTYWNDSKAPSKGLRSALGYRADADIAGTANSFITSPGTDAGTKEVGQALKASLAADASGAIGDHAAAVDAHRKVISVISDSSDAHEGGSSQDIAQERIKASKDAIEFHQKAAGLPTDAAKAAYKSAADNSNTLGSRAIAKVNSAARERTPEAFREAAKASGLAAIAHSNSKAVAINSDRKAYHDKRESVHTLNYTRMLTSARSADIARNTAVSTSRISTPAPAAEKWNDSAKAIHTKALQQEPDDKDRIRIQSMADKSRGQSHMLNLATNMASAITDPGKAVRRAKAAENENYHAVAGVFYARAKELAKGGYPVRKSDDTVQ